jgi:hypothetical protein
MVYGRNHSLKYRNWKAEVGSRKLSIESGFSPISKNKNSIGFSQNLKFKPIIFKTWNLKLET